MLGFLEMAREKLEINRKREELRKEFINTFGIEPKIVNVERAEVEVRDDEAPEIVKRAVYDLLYDLGIEAVGFVIELQVFRTIFDDEHDWKVSKCCNDVIITKRKNGLCYDITISPRF